jgi:prepilin-type N-terminal cleavage/methylation domain-containing protein
MTRTSRTYINRETGVEAPEQRLSSKQAGTGMSLESRAGTAAGFTMIELLIAMAIGTILTVMSIPVVSSAMSQMRMNSGVTALSTTISKTRYRAIRNSDIYTLAITAPQNTYVVTDVTANVVDRVEPLPTQISLNGGAAATYTFTFCANGTVYGAGANCANNFPQPPAFAITYKTRQTNMNISMVGNVKTTVIH